MDAKFKIGDRVLVTLPETITNTGMKRLNGRVFPISGVYDLKGSFIYIIEGCTLIEGYLEKVEEGVVNKVCNKNIETEAKFKIGDKVLLIKPKKATDNSEYPKDIFWYPEMDRFNESIVTITSMPSKDNGNGYGIEESTYRFHEPWLIKAEDIIKQASEISKRQLLADEVAKAIDWERRRWDLISSLVLKGKHIEIAIGIADEAILRHIETV